MEQREYKNWVQYVAKFVPIKIDGFQQFDNWYNRALLGRLLANMNLYDPAIELLESILEEAKEEDREHYVWALSDLANYYWAAKEDKDQAFLYLQEAINSFNEGMRSSFPLINKGFLYNQMWQIRALIGDGTIAEQEIIAMIEKEKMKNQSDQTDSVLYYSYFNLALFAFEKGEMDKAIKLLKEGCSYSEIEEQEIEDILQLQLSPQRTFHQLLSLTNRNLQFDI